MRRDSSRSVDRPNCRKGRVPSIVLNAPTIIAAVDGKGMTRLTGIVSTTRDLGL